MSFSSFTPSRPLRSQRFAAKTGQLVLPATITNQFLAKCFKADGGAAAAGTSKFPAFSYNGQSLRTSWNIAAETAGECA